MLDLTRVRLKIELLLKIFRWMEFRINTVTQKERKTCWVRMSRLYGLKYTQSTNSILVLLIKKQKENILSIHE